MLIKKQDMEVASADKCGQVTIKADPAWAGIDTIDCYFFHRLSLTPPVMFEHLAGTGLARFLDHSDLDFSGDHVVTNLRYVHGKSEVLKAKHTISAVLLVDPCPSEGPSENAWMTYMPDIYKKFLEEFGRREENA